MSTLAEITDRIPYRVSTVEFSMAPYPTQVDTSKLTGRVTGKEGMAICVCNIYNGVTGKPLKLTLRSKTGIVFNIERHAIKTEGNKPERVYYECMAAIDTVNSPNMVFESEKLKDIADQALIIGKEKLDVERKVPKDTNLTIHEDMTTINLAIKTDWGDGSSKFIVNSKPLPIGDLIWGAYIGHVVVRVSTVYYNKKHKVRYVVDKLYIENRVTEAKYEDIPHEPTQKRKDKSKKIEEEETEDTSDDEM